MAQYSIKEVESLSGVKAHTLRIWEQRYAFLKPERTATNIRYYTDEQLRTLLNVATLNRHGMKISKIAGLKKEDLSKEVLKIFEETTVPDELLDSLIRAMLDFDEYRFEKTLATAIVKVGFQETFTQVIFPFMGRTGVLWATGSVRIVQEHFISNLIRRKICAAIDAVYVQPSSATKKFILFLPEGETHELLLLFTEYLLRKNNHLVTYLGCSLPFNELDFVAKALKPDYMVTYQTISAGEISFREYLKKLSHDFPACKIIVGGAQLNKKIKLPPNCIFVHGADELVSVIG
jgi:DNA-binding transcriptional MerR regulator